MLTVSQLSKHFIGADDPIFQSVSFTLNHGDRVGLIGANGSGKSTLLKVIIGEIPADTGTITLAKGRMIGYLAQTLIAREDQTLADLIADSQAQSTAIEARLRALEQQMSVTTDLNAILAEYADLTEQFERIGGYELPARIDAVLTGLGVGQIDRDQPFQTLSGGEKARVALALLLLCGADLLLLDEPTSHLDRDSLTWLEGYLAAYPGAILVVSHDRHFLNQTVNVILELDDHEKTIRRYGGDYDAYARAKARERMQWIVDYANQQSEIKRLRIEIKEGAHRNNNYRTHTDGDKHVLNGKIATHEATVSRRVRLAEERLKRILADPIPEPPDPLQFRAGFEAQRLHNPDPLIVSQVSKRFGDRVVLDRVSFALSAHGRMVIVGANGAGKSTLLRVILGQETADHGEIQISRGARIGYLDQESAALDPDQTLFEAYRAGMPENDQVLKARLMRSGLFRYRDLEQRVGKLSSGQQRKLQIARLIASQANLLILDEPTNFVSLDVVEGLESALQTFAGAILVATHDRQMITHFGGSVWELADGQLYEHLQGALGYFTDPHESARSDR
ncbi:MAG: ATP-binding cassette domain-containing protein [Anaerolineae bacterium]|jgi:macrolide transport system ATP-binding/permease protein|nr:ATP-binding cassette domain-containing protein [Anaerolineae bacterium]